MQTLVYGAKRNAGSVAADEAVLVYLTAQPSAAASAGFELPRISLRCVASCLLQWIMSCFARRFSFVFS